MAMTDEARREKKRESARKFRDKNPNYAKDYYQKNKNDPDFIDRKKASRKKYKEENRDRILSQRKAYRENNKEKISQFNRRYRNKNPVAWKSLHARRKAVTDSLPSSRNGRWTEGEISFLLSNLDLPVIEICTLLQRSYDSVKNKVYNLRKSGVIE